MPAVTRYLDCTVTLYDNRQISVNADSIVFFAEVDEHTMEGLLRHLPDNAAPREEV